MSGKKIQEGLRHTVTKKIINADLASSVGTSKRNCLSTSSLILFIEQTISSLIDPYLSVDETSVSSEINIKHFRPAFVDETIRCIVHLKYVDNKKLFFNVAVLNESHEEVAVGAHSRIIINITQNAID